MDKEKTSKETPEQKKSAPGIWEWILWILFLVLPVAVFVGVFGNTIWYALKMMFVGAKTDGDIHGVPIPITERVQPQTYLTDDRHPRQQQDQVTTGNWQ